MKFRKKPVVVEAVQFTNDNKDAVFCWARAIQSGIEPSFDSAHNPILLIPTQEGESICAFGDYLIVMPNPIGWQKIEHCEQTIFKKTYAAIPDRKILIEESKTADTRSANVVVTEKMLYDSSVQHINDVGKAINFMRDTLEEIAMLHDYTKLEGIKQFHADFELTQKTKCDFTKLQWYQRHISEERHHLDQKVPSDVNLFDVLERIADIVMAGMGRTGSVYPDKLPSEVLERAYQNTIELIKNNTEVKSERKPETYERGAE